MKIRSVLERGSVPQEFWWALIIIIVISLWSSIYHTRRYKRTHEKWEDGFIGDLSFTVFVMGAIALCVPFIEHIIVKIINL